MRRGFLAMLLVSSMVLAGCFGDGETIVDSDVTAAPAWEDYILIDEKTHESPREFITVDLRTNESTNMTWAVFDDQRAGIVANITLPQPFKARFSTSVENTLYGPSIVDMTGIRGFPA